MTADSIRLLVVDDSALYRQSICNLLRNLPGIELVGTAKDGRDAIDKIQALQPDLLTLDVEMPDMNGIDVLRTIKQQRLPSKAIMVSNWTSEGADITTEALIEGAFDFILKPSSNDAAANRQELKDALFAKIAAFRQAKQTRDGVSRRPDESSTQLSNRVAETAPRPSANCQAVLIGTSTGGPQALRTVLAKLPAQLPVPVLIAQHMPPKYTRSLAARLNDNCEIEVAEAEDGAQASPGQALIAPGGKQMKLLRVANRLVTRVTDDPPENGVRPAIDYLIRSACIALSSRALAIIMTGMGQDGLAGCRELKHGGGYVFAQHQQDCVVYGMPKAVIEHGLADRVLPLGKIAPAIVRHVKLSRRL